jgi:predicted metalloprotease
MRLDDARQSDNIEDRRGMSAGGGGFGGFRIGGGGFPGGGLGIGGLIVLLALGYFLTGDPLGLLGGSDVTSPGVSQPAVPAGTTSDAAGRFISKVLADTEDTWGQLFSSANRQYEKPRLVLFDDAVDSACGLTQSAVGPFYCPNDHKVYLDLSFFNELARRFGAPGDFAQAYVVAHEVGHHVQNLLGLLNQGRPSSRAEANQNSVRQELQADCFAGVWGHYAQARGVLDPDDLNEGLRAANAIGDDRLQRQATGRVSPDSFTHGSSEQRVGWFKRGFDSGQIAACDTSR